MKIPPQEYPIPFWPYSDGWHCSICGKKVENSYTACCLHENGPVEISGELSTCNEIPNRVSEILFKLDDMIIKMNGFVSSELVPMLSNGKQKIVSKEIPSNCNYYTFRCSNIDMDLLEARMRC